MKDMKVGWQMGMRGRHEGGVAAAYLQGGSGLWGVGVGDTREQLGVNMNKE